MHSKQDATSFIDTGFGIVPTPVVPEGCPEPAWELATMWPPQGSWTLEEYLSLTDGTNRLIELVDGRLEFLAMPTETHQEILLYLLDLIRAAIEPGSGKVLFAGLRVHTLEDNAREPDIVFVRKENYSQRSERYWLGADLVMEVVSPDAKSRERDYVEKRAEYARAGIAEYWIVDPQEAKITVLTLPEGGGEYAEHGVFTPGESATSVLLEGFAVDVKACFDAAKQ